MTWSWLGDLRTAVRGGLADDLAQGSASDLLTLARELESVRRQLSALDTHLVAQLDARAVAGEFARCSTADLLVSELRVTPAEAKARVRQAGDLAPRRTLAGQPMPPLLPATATALSDGLLPAGHAAVISACLEHLPGGTSLDTMAVVEDTLVHAAQHEHPAALRKDRGAAARPHRPRRCGAARGRTGAAARGEPGPQSRRLRSADRPVDR